MTLWNIELSLPEEQALTCTALLRKQLFSPGAFSNPLDITIDVVFLGWNTRKPDDDGGVGVIRVLCPRDDIQELALSNVPDNPGSLPAIMLADACQSVGFNGIIRVAN